MLNSPLRPKSRPRLGPRRTAGCLAAVAAILLASQPARAASQFPHDDVQGWVDLEASHSLRENLQLLLSGTLRESWDAGHIVYRRGGGGLAFKVNKYLTLTPFYSVYFTDRTPVSETHENRISLAATVGVPRGRWKISDRNTVERRFLVGSKTWRYRNRLELDRDTRIAHIPLRLFVWDEVFYDSAVGAWSRNRAAVGGGKEITRHLALDLYYVLQNDSHLRPGDLNVIGVTIRTHF